MCHVISLEYLNLSTYEEVYHGCVYDIWINPILKHRWIFTFSKLIPKCDYQILMGGQFT